MESFLIEAQLESREELEEITRKHATLGGFLEMGIRTYEEKGSAYIASHMRMAIRETVDPDAAEIVEKIAYSVTEEIAEHGKTTSQRL